MMSKIEIKTGLPVCITNIYHFTEQNSEADVKISGFSSFREKKVVDKRFIIQTVPRVWLISLKTNHSVIISTVPVFKSDLRQPEK